MEIKLASITHNELVYLLSTATYASNYLLIRVMPKEYYNIDKEYPSWEDKLADRLELGGHLEIVDTEDDDFNDDNPFDKNSPSYHCINLDDIYKGLEKAFNDKETRSIVCEFFNENADFYTAYNLMQIILFGEIVYG